MAKSNILRALTTRGLPSIHRAVHGKAREWNTCQHAINTNALNRQKRFIKERYPLFKVGEFYGMSEEFHVHVLRAENAFVVNLFNLSDESRLISGAIPFDRIGLDRDRWYVSPYTHEEGRFDRESGACLIQRRLAPWSAEVIHVYSLPLSGDTGRTANL